MKLFETDKTQLLGKMLRANSQEEVQALKSAVVEAGYSYFNTFLQTLRAKLRHFDETELKQMEEVLAKGRSIVPNPVILSPSWDKLWDRLEQIVEMKSEVLRAVPAEDRAGEWQVILDNPFSNEGIICHAAPTFAEAAYLYAYFRQDLLPAEFVRLQKVTSVMFHHGGG